MTATPSERLSIGICLGFGFGTVGVSIMLNTVTAYFPAFMSTVLGQSPEVAGYLLMGSKLFDAVIDLVIGTFSDRTRSRWGRRRPYLLAGAIVSSASFLMIFAPQVHGQAALIAWMIAALMLYSAGYSLFNVPYMAMPSEITQGYHERTRLLSYRTVFVSIGQLLAIAGAAALIQHGGGGMSGYRTMAMIMALIIFGAMMATLVGTRNAAESPAPTKERASGSALRLLIANRPFMMLLGAKVFQFLSFASIATTGLLYLLNVVGVGYSGQIVLSVTQNVVSALTMPLWVWLGRRIGKRQTYLIGVALFCVTALSWLAVDRGIDTVGLVLRGISSGAGSGAIILMSVSMLGDTMAYDRLLTGHQREGLLSSIIAVTEKTSFALGVVIVGLMLKLFGYVPSFDGKLVAQPHSAVVAMTLGFAVLPTVLYLFNAVFLWRYDLDEARLKQAS